MNIRKVLEKMIASRASDLHLKAGTAPIVRVDGVLYTLDDPAPSAQELRDVCNQLLNDEQRPAGVEQMVVLMEKFAEKGKNAAAEAERVEATKGLIFAANILAAVTGQKLGTDVKKWREYSEQLKAERRPR